MRKSKIISGVFLLLFLIPVIHSASAGTDFTQQAGDTILFGNNEDYSRFNSTLWFFPSQDNAYGYAGVGYYTGDLSDVVLNTGMNDQGLVFDVNGLPDALLTPQPGKPVTGDLELRSAILRECANVSEVIDWYGSHDLGSTLGRQYLFADAAGDAVVVSAGPDGDLAFTRKNGSSSYLVSTNFNLANTDNGLYPSGNYDTAVSMLEEVEQEGNLSVEDFTNILDATHSEGEYGTKYSSIFNLKTGEIYLYIYHDFSRAVNFSLEEELAKGQQEILISDLFPGATSPQATGMELYFVIPGLILLTFIRWKKRVRN